jgi:hypothetical protein
LAYSAVARSVDQRATQWMTHGYRTPREALLSREDGGLR